MNKSNLAVIPHEDSVAFEAINKLGAGKTIHPVIEQLDICLKFNIVPFLEGQPGVAKSSLVYQFAAMKGLDIIEFRPALEDLSGIKGLPNFVVDGEDTIVDWAIPAHFPRDPDWKGVFFIDEIVKAAPSMQGALSQLVLDRRVGGYELPKGAIIVLAGNRTKDRAAAFRMPSDLANRVSRIPVDFHIDAWTSWAQENDILPVATAFANYRSGLFKFDPSAEVNCTPRTFTMVSPLVEEDHGVTISVAQGLIGEGPAAEYFGFYQYWNSVPTLKAVIEKGAILPLPEKPEVQYATIAKLALETTKENIEGIWSYMGRFTRENQTVYWRNVLKAEKAMAANPVFGEWFGENANFLA